MKNPFGALFERRSIGSSADLLNYLLRGYESVSGQNVNENSAFNVAAVMTCVSIRSRALASLPVRVYERLDERSKRPAVDHPLSRVLLKPNSWQTRTEFVAMLEVHRILRGNGYAWINRITATSRDGQDREQVEELIPMHPDQVEVIEKPNEFGEPTTYKLHKRDGSIVPLPSREVMHLKGLSTDGRRGRSAIQDMRESIGGSLATQESANAFWSRDATPSVVLRHPKSPSEKAKKNLEESWESIYGRGKNKRRVAVLEEGMEITPLSLSAQDSQFLETRKFLRSEIAGALHVPPFMIGDTEKSTSWGTGIEQQQIGFLTFTLRPDLVTWEQRLNLDLMSRPDKYFIEFNVDAMMRGDSAAQSQYFWRMIQMGVFSPNDVRALLNMNPIDAGDIYLQPSNMAPLGSDPTATNTAKMQDIFEAFRAEHVKFIEQLAHQEPPTVNVDARTTIEAGAIQHHAAPVTVEGTTVTVEGAEPVAMVQDVTRDDKGHMNRIVSTPVKRA